MISRTIETNISVDNLTTLLEDQAINRLRELGFIRPFESVTEVKFGEGTIPVRFTIEEKEVEVTGNGKS